MTKLPIKHPSQKRLDDAIERLKVQKRIPKKPKKEVIIQSGHRKVKKEEE